jgi:hypothetical protein
MDYEALFRWAVKQPHIKPVEKLVLVALVRYVGDAPTGNSYVDLIADEAQLALRTTKEILKRLQSYGLIGRARRAGFHEKQYTLNSRVIYGITPAR